MYIPLNIKTDYSLLKSTIKIKNLINFAKENDIKALTITDDNMFGAMEFYEACIKNNIKPIIGLNVKINDFDIILYAKNSDGYVNLLKIVNIYRENNLDIEILKKYNNNLICILPYESRKLYKELENVYHNIFVSYKNNEQKNKINISNKLYMNEILVLKEEDNICLNYLKAIRENHLLEEENYKNELKLEVEDNSFIYDLVDIKINKRNDLLPKYDTNGIDSFTYLKNICKEGMKKRFGNQVGSKYIERLRKELDTIHKLNFDDYFLIVQDYVNFAHQNKILVGPGRGSAVGSLVAYVLGITDIDPLKYGLLFERFLNEKRITMPDIDIDFDGSRRHEVIDYCIKKYGEKSVCGIITFVTMGSKQIIKEVGKTLDVKESELDYFVKLIDTNKTLKENKTNDLIKNYLLKNEEMSKVFDIAIKLEGIKRTTSVNASGIVISSKNLENYIPLEKKDTMYLSGYAMNELESLGLLKMDFLALKNLTTIKTITDEIKAIDLKNIPLDDKKTLEIFNTSDTLGIFQFETDGMRNVLKKFPIDSFEDIYNLTALFRPGPASNIDSYIRRKKGQEQINYFHSDLVPILKSTYGIIIYQEQIMQIANVLSDYSLKEADILRRAMSKKKEKVLLEEREKFITRALSKGYEKQLIENIYDLILKFAEYGFNKSHSVAYATISYQMAYLKANYPEYFLKHFLSYSLGSTKIISEYINECKKMNIELISPDINSSTNNFLIDEGILFPINSIKEISENLANYIIEIREKNNFKTIYDFLIRTDSKIITKEIVKKLIFSGCFDSLIPNRKTIIENLDIIINYTDLYKEFGSAFALEPDIKIYEEYNQKELIKEQFESFGFYINQNPIVEYRKEFKIEKTLSNLTNYIRRVTTFIVTIDEIKEITNKNNEKMAFIKCSDEFTRVDGVIFSNAYKEMPKLQPNDIIKLIGKPDRRNGKDQIIVNKVEIL